MNLVKIIFFSIILTINVYSADDHGATENIAVEEGGIVAEGEEELTWTQIHENIRTMSWRNTYLNSLRNMERAGGIGELTEDERNEILTRAARGQTADGEDITLPHGSEPVIDLSEYFTGLRTILTSGYVPPTLSNYYFRDRRFITGLFFDSMDIIRQRPITQSLLNTPDNLVNNDLLKVRALSGTFWHRKDGNLVRAFTGMIQPGQEIPPHGEGHTINIISCFHGIWKKHLDDLYFLPKGLAPNPKNLFQIKSVQMGGVGSFKKQAEVNIVSEAWSASEWQDIFSHQDYVIIKVSNIAADNSIDNTLTRHLPAELINNGRIVRLNGNVINAADFHPNRVFVYGRPGKPIPDAYLQGEDGFCLVTDLYNGNAIESDLLENPPLVHFLRKLQENAAASELNPLLSANYIRPTPTPLVRSKASSIPLSPGISGGPFLKCAINQIPAASIHCQLIGVAQAGGLIGNNDDDLSFKGLIAIPQ